MSYATTTAVFNLQVSTIQSATESLVNATHAHFQKHGDRYINAFQFAIRGTARIALGVAIAAISICVLLGIGILVAKRAIDQYINSRLIEEEIDTPCMLRRAIARCFYIDFVQPSIAIAVSLIVQSAIAKHAFLEWLCRTLLVMVRA